jgi:hypothetical protein
VARILKGEILICTLSVDRTGKELGNAEPEELAHIIDGLNEIIGS